MMTGNRIEKSEESPGSIRESPQKKAQESFDSWALSVFRKFADPNLQSVPGLHLGIPR